MTEVVRDLMIRGVVRYQQGWSLEAILKTDAPAVLNQVYMDLAEVGGGIAGELLRGVVGVAEHKLQGIVNSIADAFGKRR
jgi:hypothetical protein